MASLSGIRSWDVETDLLVAGYGLAGACAAIEAHDLDPHCEILVLEKMPRASAGGNTRVSGQSLLISRDAKALADYQRVMSATNPVPEEMLLAWAKAMTELEPWIQARAAEAGARYVKGTGFSEREAVREFPELGADAAVAYTATILPIPSGVWLAFDANVAKRPRVKVQYETKIVDLVQDPDTLEVFGAVVEHAGVRQCVKARRGVVMATGGFAASPQMHRDYFGLAQAYPLGTPGNTGDGLRILQKAGADLWHLRNFGQSGGIWPGFKVPDYETVFLRNFFWQTFSWLELDAENRRFYDETAELQLTHYKEKRHGHWVDTPHHQAWPVHMVFDELTRTNNCLAIKVMGWNPIVNGYDWSDDNAAEVERGWIVRADSIGDLARQLGRDPVAVERAVAEYNAACCAGHDAAFGRNPATLQPIERPPYYAIRIDPAIVCTSGGARRNIESEVLGHEGQPIPRLYEAGELGSMVSNLYQNGTYLTECMISGRAAGRNAVGLAPWDAPGTPA
jgi:succinate dehydrogenase/fumarate reductase flavoprotein subunit